MFKRRSLLSRSALLSICCSVLLGSSHSHALIGALTLNPILLSAGGLCALGLAPTAAVVAFEQEKDGSPKGSKIAGGIGLGLFVAGLVILEDGATVAYAPLSPSQQKALGVSEQAHQAYVDHLNEINAIRETVASETHSLVENQRLWSVYLADLGTSAQDTSLILDVLQAIARSAVQPSR